MTCCAEEAAARADVRVDQVRAADEQWRAFEAEHGWRHERIVAINDRLDHHWARAALSAVREDDPLAFGVDELRRARATYAADLDTAVFTAPADRSEVRRALREIDAALEETRVERVRALARNDSPPSYVVGSLGEVPLSRGGQRAWCGLAAEIEQYRDRHAVTSEVLALGPEPRMGVPQQLRQEWSRVHDLVQNADDIIDTAHELDLVQRHSIDDADGQLWARSVMNARRRVEAIREVAAPEVSIEAEPDLGLSW